MVTGNREDSEPCVLLDDESDQYISANESQLTLIEEEGLPCITKIADPGQCCSNGVSLVEEIERRVQTWQDISEGDCQGIKISECKENLIQEDSLQRSKQLSLEVSEIIDLEKRYC